MSILVLWVGIGLLLSGAAATYDDTSSALDVGLYSLLICVCWPIWLAAGLATLVFVALVLGLGLAVCALGWLLSLGRAWK